MTDLPGAPEAESALLGRLLLEPRQIPLVAPKLAPADFAAEGNRRIYQAMLELSQANRVVDVTTLSAEMGSTSLVSDLAREIGPGHHAPIDEYVAIINNAAFKRNVIGTFTAVIGRAYEPEVDRGTLLADLQDAVSRVSQGMASGRLVSPSEAVDLYLGLLAERSSGRGLGLDYGIKALDDLIQPAQGGDMIVLAARPSIGKTALADVISDVWAAVRPPVLFASLEMSLRQLMDRAVARLSGIDALDIVRGVKHETEVHDEATRRRGEVHLAFLGEDDPDAVLDAELREAAVLGQAAGEPRQGIGVQGPHLVGFDHLDEVAIPRPCLRALAP